MGKLFGTDGVRGVANRELNPELAFKLGRAGAFVLSREATRPRIVIGKDTRISGDMLEAALTAGICSVGADVLHVGVIPTPGVAFLTRDLEAAAGVVISASHNPVADNGIKFFGGNGYKLPDELESEIESHLDEIDELPVPTGGGVGRVIPVPDAADRYVRFLKNTIDVDLTGLKIVVDCANGAAFSVGPRVLRELGAEVVSLHDQPDGVNINKQCGSTNPESVCEAVPRLGADIGLAHDGDADRVLAVDEQGRLVDGDFIMVICGLDLQKQGRLAGNRVVVTVMSNLGLHLALRKAGVEIGETRVGDRYVLEEMLKTGAALGGEQSGHIIFLDHNTTGDGLVTALNLLAVLKRSGKPLSALAAQMTRLPQVLVNVRVKEKSGLLAIPELAEAIQAAEERLKGIGRILVRPSGTEPLVRVMVEGPDEAELTAIADQVASIISENG